eukprot:SAG22_NODE_4426_length_1272_cov_1.782609_1_plen_68_part_00
MAENDAGGDGGWLDAETQELLEKIPGWTCKVIQYGFIPAVILFGMKKDPRITWFDVLAPFPTAAQPM